MNAREESAFTAWLAGEDCETACRGCGSLLPSDEEVGSGVCLDCAEWVEWDGEEAL